MKKIGILHFSDIHFKTGTNSALSRIDQIVGAVASHTHEIDEILLIISGDISYSGDPEEYKIGLGFIEKLKAEFQRNSIKLHEEIVTTPGNHDCSFTESNSIRDMFLANTIANRSLLDANMLDACLKPQAAYRDFAATLTSYGTSDKNRIFDSRTIEFSGVKFLINTCNTAWLSRKNEIQGSIFIPPELILAKASTEIDLSITIFHHPYNWFEAINAREYRARIEEMSDLVLTGHEHEGGSFRRTSSEDESNDYIEGYALQDSYDKENSGFNIITLDLKERSFINNPYRWRGKYYGISEPVQPRQFANHARAMVGAFDPSEKFRSLLDDPGARYSHPQVGYVTLSQIFVSPDFREISETESPKITHNSIVRGKDAFNAISARERTLITGTEKSGRTCLAKRIAMRLLRDARVPVFIATSKDNKLVSPEGIDRLIERVFGEQYNEELWELYCQLPKAKRAVVIDDLHLAAINRRGKHLLIQKLLARFGSVIILGDESLRLEDISSRNKEGALFDGFSEFQVLEFGRVLRDKVISKWITLGQENEITESVYDNKTKSYAHAIDTVLGKNLVPAYPVFILVILQQLEAGVHHTTNNGSYGYFYEYLITKSLAGNSPGEVDLKYNFLSEFAWILHKEDRRAMSEFEFAQFTRNYSTDFKIHINGAQMLDELVKSGILTKNNAAEISFKYKYNTYYFSARWLSQNLSTPIAQDRIKALADEIHREEYANIIIFLSYLSKDKSIIDVILKCSKELYPDVAPCDMSAHTGYLNKLQDRVPELVYEEMDGASSRAKALSQMDEHDKQEQEKENEEYQAAELLKINRAFKTVDVLGQILKNYAGSMRGEVKLEVARECVAVALRSMNFFLSLLESNLQGFVDYLVEYYVKQEKIDDQQEIISKAKQLIFFLANTWAIGVIKRVSRSAGSQQLEQIYSELNLEFGSVSMNLVDISVRLDHFSTFPQALVEKAHADIKDNFFADSVLQRLVVTHFYLFPVDFKIREAICNKLGIKIEKSKILDDSIKKL